MRVCLLLAGLSLCSVPPNWAFRHDYSWCPWQLVSCHVNHVNLTEACTGLYHRSCSCKANRGFVPCNGFDSQRRLNPHDCTPAPDCLVRPAWCPWSKCRERLRKRLRAPCCHPGSGTRLPGHRCVRPSSGMPSGPCPQPAQPKRSATMVSVDVIIGALIFFCVLYTSYLLLKSWHRRFASREGDSIVPEEISLSVRTNHDLPPAASLRTAPPSYEDAVRSCRRPPQTFG